MNELTIAFTFSAFVVGFLCSLVLIKYNIKHPFPSYYLVGCILSLSIIALWSSLTYTDFFYRFPFFFRLSLPFQYLVAPLIYLFIRGSVNNKRTFGKYTWLHFLPAILHLIEYCPMYFSSDETKREIMNTIFKNLNLVLQYREGILPPFVHLYLKIVQGSVYILLAARLLYFLRKRTVQWSTQTKETYVWMILLLMQFSIFYICLFFTLMLSKYSPNFANYMYLTLVVILYFCAFSLFFKPSVLYGIQINAPYPSITDVEHTENTLDIKKFSLSDQKIYAYKEKLNEIFKEKSPFLQTNYSIRQLSSDCNIPVHHLSLLINREHGLNYTDFVNNARIQYLILNYSSERWKFLKLEGIAKESGFTSRSTFINAFKKVTGVTPSEYFSQQKNNVMPVG